MSTKNDKIRSYSAVLDKKYGKEGTPERRQFDIESFEFYASQIILQSRKEAKITQRELAEKANIDKSYVSRIERGTVQPTLTTFLRLINAMGKSLEII